MKAFGVLVLVLALVAVSYALTCDEARLTCCALRANSLITDPICEAEVTLLDYEYGNCTNELNNVEAILNCTQRDLTIVQTDLDLLRNFLQEAYSLRWCLRQFPPNATFETAFECLPYATQLLQSNFIEGVQEVPYDVYGFFVIKAAFPLAFQEMTHELYNQTWGIDYCREDMPYITCRTPSDRLNYLNNAQAYKHVQFPPDDIVTASEFLKYSNYCLESMFSTANTGFCQGTKYDIDCSTCVSGIWWPYDQLAPFVNFTENYYLPFNNIPEVDVIALTTYDNEAPPGWPYDLYWMITSAEMLLLEGASIDVLIEIKRNSVAPFVTPRVLVLENCYIVPENLPNILYNTNIAVLAMKNVNSTSDSLYSFAMSTELVKLYLDNVALVYTTNTSYAVDTSLGIMGNFVYLTDLVLKNMELDASVFTACGTLNVSLPLERLALTVNFINGPFDYLGFAQCASNLQELYIDGLNDTFIDFNVSTIVDLFPRLRKLTLKNMVVDFHDIYFCPEANLVSFSLSNVLIINPTSTLSMFSDCTLELFSIVDVDTQNSNVPIILSISSGGAVILQNTDLVGPMPFLIGAPSVLIIDNAGLMTPPVYEFLIYSNLDTCVVVNSGPICIAAPADCCSMLNEWILTVS
jgi:hypothetical protein